MSARARERRIAVLRHLGTLLFLVATFTSFGGCSGCGCGCDREPMMMRSCSCSFPSLSCSGGCAPGTPRDAGPIDARDTPPEDVPRDTRFSTFDVPRDPCDYGTPGAAIGSVCLADGSCSGALACETELVAPLVSGGGLAIASGTCGLPCDPLADACGSCARCSSDVPVGAGRLGTSPVCRPRCTPTLLDRGDCGPGFTCDARSAVCVPACRSDRDCQIEPVVSAGGVAFAEQPLLRCDFVTGRCLRPDPVPMVGHGAPCADDLDCAAGDECWRPSLTRLGMCTRFGCASPGRACDPGALCDGWECVLPCLTSSDCPAGLGCEPSMGACWLNCASTADCGGGFVCETELGCTTDCFCTLDTRP